MRKSIEGNITKYLSKNTKIIYIKEAELNKEVVCEAKVTKSKLQNTPNAEIAKTVHI